jgi:hypothetical protein
MYVAYSTFYIMGTMLSMQVSFIGFQPVYSSEHMVSGLGVLPRDHLAPRHPHTRSRSSTASTAPAWLVCLTSP